MSHLNSNQQQKARESIQALMPLTGQLYKSGEFKQPNYILPMVLAAAQGICLGVERVTSIEFGVASGRGLMDMCKIAKSIKEVVNVEFDIFGFDTYTGLPKIVDYRDHPEIWSQGQYSTPDFDSLERSLPSNCKLIVGNVRDTVPRFAVNGISANSLIGFISVDLDLYSSTKDALTILNFNSNYYIPSVLMYFDDIDGNITLNKWCGEELAIEEFNVSQQFRKIQRKICSSPKMFCCHVLDHEVRLGNRAPVIPIELPVVKFQR